VALPNHSDGDDGCSPASARWPPAPTSWRCASSRRWSTGVKLAKTYTFKRGEYTVGVRHEVVNQGTAAITPQLYLQLGARRQPARRRDARSTSPSPGRRSTPTAKKFQKVDFKDIAKGNASHEQGRQRRLDRDGAALLRIGLGGVRRRARASSAPPRSADNHYTVAMVLPLGEVAPGQPARRTRRVLFAGPQEENKLAALAPGLELVKDYGWFTVLAKPLFWLLDKLHGMIGNWGWAIVALVRAAEDRLLLAERQRLPQHGQDEGRGAQA
jgi:YidC/Oxa1 family membrane protein insertase